MSRNMKTKAKGKKTAKKKANKPQGNGEGYLRRSVIEKIKKNIVSSICLNGKLLSGEELDLLCRLTGTGNEEVASWFGQYALVVNTWKIKSVLSREKTNLLKGNFFRKNIEMSMKRK